MKKNFKTLFAILAFTTFGVSKAQVVRPTLELTKDGGNVTALGPTVASQNMTFLLDLQNPVIPTNSPTFTNDPNPLRITMSIVNQQRSTILTGTTTVIPGITFGGRNTDDNSTSVGADDPAGTPGVQAIGSALLYNIFAAEIPASKPLNNMFVTSPSGNTYAKTSTSAGGSLTEGGFDTQATSGAQGPAAVDLGGFYGGDDDANFGVPIYLTTEPLHDIMATPGDKFYYGDLVLTFNRPVKDPMVHLGGLGGSYTYLASPAAGGGTFSTFFSTELQLVNAPPNSLQVKAGNLNISTTTNNDILNINNSPNAGSVTGDATYGAASGSVKVTGTYTQLVFKLYMRGTAGNFGWSQTAENISAANRDPLNGDVWYMSLSTDKPTQQISGNVFYDKDSIAGDIWRNVATGERYQKTDGSDSVNAITNGLAGVFYANLLDNNGLILASTPIAKDGSYLFDNVAVGTYTVGLSGGPLTVGGPMAAGVYPDKWINTGERIDTIAGTDGIRDGISAPIVIAAGDIRPNVNFGVYRSETLPVDLLSFYGRLNGSIAKLTWEVENEINFDDYDVERSEDGLNFTKIATVNARQQGSLRQTYTLDDNLTGKIGKYYYRLRSNNLDRSFKYSNIVIVRIGSVRLKEIYPNPFTSFIRVEIESNKKEKATVKVTDINGITVAFQTVNLEAGGNQFTISNLAKLAQGTYYLEVTTSTEKISEKVIKLK